MRRLLLPALLAGLTAACQPQREAPAYGPWAEGLTLAFEDPSLPQPERSQRRQQVRVSRSALAPGAPKLVQLEVASLSMPPAPVLMRHEKGGIALLDGQGRVVAQPLPAGFPEVASWEAHGTAFRVVGRALWEGAALLPPTYDPVGIWVEARQAQGPPRRSLFLPNLGEVETQELRQGAWVPVNRLVAMGFTDPPAHARP